MSPRTQQPQQFPFNSIPHVFGPNLTLDSFSAIATPSQFFGTLVVGTIGDRFGRKELAQASLLFLLVGAILEATTKIWVQWFLAKMLNTFGTGLLATGVGALVAELAPREVRGLALNSFQLFGM